MIWFTGDTHLGHDNIRVYCDRPFPTIEEHDQALVENWNSLIKPKDTVYHLGDLAFFKGKNKTYALVNLINSLNGKKFLVPGNHDKLNKIKKFRVDFTILDKIHEFNVQDPEIGKAFIVLSHYPIESWNKKHFGSIHLHGHVHSKGRKIRNRIDVGVDSNEYTPVAYEDIKIRCTKELLNNGV